MSHALLELDSVAMERLRWRCRRGLLELDIVLQRFIGHYPALDDVQRQVFDELLELPDNQLWDLICGRVNAERDEHGQLLELINNA